MFGKLAIIVGLILQRKYFHVGASEADSCPDRQTVDSVPVFTSKITTDKMNVRLGHYIELRCCATHFDRINWYKEIQGTWRTFIPAPPQLNPLAPILVEDGQILVIKSATVSDEGNYKCALEKEGIEVDKRKITLTVTECDELARGPYLIAPTPCGITPVKLGVSIALPCIGYFGCGNDEFKKVTWFVSSIDGRTDWKPVSAMSDRYQMQYFERNGKSEIGANLTITSIKVEDLDRKFMCLLSTPQVIEGETKLIVHLEHRQSKDEDLSVDLANINLRLVGLITGVTILVLTFMFIVTMIVCKRKQRKEMLQRANLPEQETRFIPSSSCVVKNV